MTKEDYAIKRIREILISLDDESAEEVIKKLAVEYGLIEDIY